MNIVVYSDEIYSKIIEFLIKKSINDPYQTWDSGRMNFWRYGVHGKKSDQDQFFKDNVRTYMDSGKVIGLVISEYGGEDIFIEVALGYEHLFDEMFHWVEHVWATDKKAIYMDAYENHEDKIKTILGHNYQFERHDENKRLYDLTSIDMQYKLKEGFKIKAFYEYPNYESRANLVNSAFNRTDYTKDNLDKLHSSKEYIKALDLGVISPEGIFVAYCVGWRWTGKPGWGYIEPVGTHKAFRKMGFGTSVIKECFYRMANLGIDRVEISSLAEPNVANFLYDSLNPYEKLRVFKYKRELV